MSAKKEKSTKRIKNELKDCEADGITVNVDDADMFTWNVIMQGPAKSVYEGGTFKVLVKLPVPSEVGGKSQEGYPFKPPVITFQTKIYHPNIYDDGAPCLAMLRSGDSEHTRSEGWKPVNKIMDVLKIIRHLLVEPNPDEPANTQAASDFKENRAAFDKRAREDVKKHASAHA